MDDGEIAVLTADSCGRVRRRAACRWKRHHSTGGLGRLRGGKGRLRPLHGSRRSWSSRRPSARPSPPASGTAGWCWMTCSLTAEYVRDIYRIFVIACGSSYHVGMVSKYNLGAAAAPAGGGGAGLASSATATPWWTKRPWSWSSASPARPWTPWPPCGRPSAGAAGPWPSSTWWAPPSPGRRTTCSTPGPGRRSPWPPPRPTPPSWC